MRTWLKDYRTQRHLTQAELADQLGIAPTTFASYEQGARTPTVEQAIKISKKLNVDWTIFFETELHIMSKDVKE